MNVQPEVLEAISKKLNLTVTEAAAMKIVIKIADTSGRINSLRKHLVSEGMHPVYTTALSKKGLIKNAASKATPSWSLTPSVMEMLKAGVEDSMAEANSASHGVQEPTISPENKIASSTEQLAGKLGELWQALWQRKDGTRVLISEQVLTDICKQVGLTVEYFWNTVKKFENRKLLARTGRDGMSIIIKFKANPEVIPGPAEAPDVELLTMLKAEIYAPTAPPQESPELQPRRNDNGNENGNGKTTIGEVSRTAPTPTTDTDDEYAKIDNDAKELFARLFKESKDNWRDTFDDTLDLSAEIAKLEQDKKGNRKQLKEKRAELRNKKNEFKRMEEKNTGKVLMYLMRGIM